MHLHAQATSVRWLAENGPAELELIFQAICLPPSMSALLTDDDRLSSAASMGAGKLFGLPRKNLLGCRLDEFEEQDSGPVLSERWESFLNDGYQEGRLRLNGRDGTPRNVHYTAVGNVLPARHLVNLREEFDSTTTSTQEPSSQKANHIPRWAQDCALLLLDPKGHVFAWYAGAERIYGHRKEACLGRHVAMCYPQETGLSGTAGAELGRALRERHVCTETWHQRKDGSRFWANMVTKALRDQNDILCGFAVAVRDFSDRQERDDHLRNNRREFQPSTVDAPISGVVWGAFDRDPEANDAFLELVGYSRQGLQDGCVHLLDLTPSEYTPLDELAREEALQFGACVPFEKELLRKDGTRISVQVTTALLTLTPFRWITFIHDLKPSDRI
ncbi:MAG: PAS domain S-box protein, partial [Acidobacteriota bacterium]